MTIEPRWNYDTRIEPTQSGKTAIAAARCCAVMNDFAPGGTIFRSPAAISQAAFLDFLHTLVTEPTSHSFTDTEPEERS